MTQHTLAAFRHLNVRAPWRNILRRAIQVYGDIARVDDNFNGRFLRSRLFTLPGAIFVGRTHRTNECRRNRSSSNYIFSMYLLLDSFVVCPRETYALLGGTHMEFILGRQLTIYIYACAAFPIIVDAMIHIELGKYYERQNGGINLFKQLVIT